MTEERESPMEPITLHCLAPSSIELSPANGSSNWQVPEPETSGEVDAHA